MKPFKNLPNRQFQNIQQRLLGTIILSESLLLESIPRYDEAEVCLAKALEFEADSLKYLVKFGQLKQLLGRF